MILSGCGNTLTKTKLIKVDTFCEGKYKPLFFTNEEYDKIDKARSSEFGDIIEVYIKNHALNAREYDACPIKEF